MLTLEYKGVLIIEMPNGLYLLDELGELAVNMADAMKKINLAWLGGTK